MKLDVVQRWFQAVVTHPEGVEGGAESEEAQRLIRLRQGELEAVIRRSGRRVAFAVAGGAALLSAALTASSAHLSVWIPALLGGLGVALIVGLLTDLARSRE